MAAPQDIRDVQTIKHEGIFILCDRFGDIQPESPAALGMYFHDTRFLSQWELLVDGRKPLWLHAEADKNYSMLVETNVPIEDVFIDGTRRVENLQVSRHRWLECGMQEVIRFHNFGKAPRGVVVELAFGADFRDVFEVRGMLKEHRGATLQPEVRDAQVVLGYEGLDGVRRTLEVTFSTKPDELTAERAVWKLPIESKQELDIVVSAQPHVGDVSPPDVTHDDLDRDYAAWRKACTRFRVSNGQLQQYLDRAVLDMRMMVTHDEKGLPAIDAGVPWFSTLFGRDSLLTAYQTLIINPDLAKGTLEKLAQYQGDRVDEWRDEEPGKILHELRCGELAAIGEVPHTPYYGTIDATPLWLVVYGYVWNWTADREFAERMWPHAMRALEWIDTYGDADGDGYVEYRRRSGGGLDNQGWKDSYDGILDEDGTIAEAPLALCEVQGYVYDARRRLATVARALGHHDLADEQEKRAEELKERFNKDFWQNDLSMYAVALGADKQPVRSITSNPGHCLWSGIVDKKYAQRLVRRLLAPDMLSGWGIRTLSARNPGFDPIGYHVGTVWPHDNSIIAHGLKLYGFSEESNRLINELALAGAHFAAGRYPELFCGYSRTDVPVPVEYPVACRPQAWATGATLLMLRSYGGITANAPEKTLSIVRPNLPVWLERAEIIGMRVGNARVDLQFLQAHGTTAVQVMRKDGDLDVVVRY